jgi:pimeloyl-ACP methyl ester carboxylesterase
VILPHGGLGQSGNWGYQVPALVRRGYRAVVIDSRGHGRSTRDARPLNQPQNLLAEQLELPVLVGDRPQQHPLRPDLLVGCQLLGTFLSWADQ